MRALTIRQPWAWLIAAGHKDIENRTWKTPYRGPLAIHAGKTDDTGLKQLRLHFRDVGIVIPDDLQRGGIIAVADLVDCVPQHPSKWYIPGHIAWVLANPRPVKLVPCRGYQHLFTPTADVERHICLP